jgi:hypothetical protein
MLLLISGLVVLAITAVLFWNFMPRDGKLHRFADTEWESYVGVAFCSAIALSFTMALSGIINMLGTQ